MYCFCSSHTGWFIDVFQLFIYSFYAKMKEQRSQGRPNPHCTLVYWFISLICYPKLTIREGLIRCNLLTIRRHFFGGSTLLTICHYSIEIFRFCLPRFIYVFGSPTCGICAGVPICSMISLNVVPAFRR